MLFSRQQTTDFQWHLSDTYILDKKDVLRRLNGDCDIARAQKCFFFCTKLLLFIIGFSSENVNLLLFQSLTVLLFVSTVTRTSTT